ncbi:LysE family transporter [Acidothermaceae bacterium B102]|nr:LysE family transporter [Acidothermaceae bacterium B102]
MTTPVMDALGAGVLAGYGIAVPIGPVGVYLLSLGSRTSWRVAAAAALGVATADGIFATVAVVGGATLAPAIEPVRTPLRWVSAVVLVVLAGRIARAAVRGYVSDAAPGLDAGSPGRRAAFVRMLGVTLVNPGTLVYFVALAVGVRSGAPVSATDQTVFVVAACAASASWQLLLVTSGAALGRRLGSPRGRLATALVSSTLIVVLAARLALQA